MCLEESICWHEKNEADLCRSVYELDTFRLLVAKPRVKLFYHRMIRAKQICTGRCYLVCYSVLISLLFCFTNVVAEMCCVLFL